MVAGWLRTVAVGFCLSGFAADVPAQLNRHGLADRLQAQLVSMGLPTHALARDPNAQGALRLPGAWRRDPLVELAAVDALRQSVSLNNGDPAAALDGFLDLAHSGRRRQAGQPAPPTLAPPPPGMPEPLRGEIVEALAGIAMAAKWREAALSALPPGLAPVEVLRQLVPSGVGPARGGEGGPPPPALATLLPLVDHHALAQGARLLAKTAQRLQRRLSAGGLPRGAWHWSTALGEVAVDTTGVANAWTGLQPLLLIDVGGDDLYRFGELADASVRMLIDHGGSDVYVSDKPGTDPSAAALGYALLWDSAGDDRYQGAWLAQGSAVLGAALHLDTAGHDTYRALGMSQAFACGGLALLYSKGGSDRYEALTQSQAAAGPDGVAFLLDTDGDDRYSLAAEPLVQPSAQLPDRNASLGQGAAYGWRPQSPDEAPVPGGWALLMDLRGDDSYEAQVFAQAAGYAGGLGMLVDAGGGNRWRAAWYAMGAAAHGAGALFIAGGAGSDRYDASHSTSMGAAHDDSLALFIDTGGDDAYVLGTLGWGASHDHSTALFMDEAGQDAFDHLGKPCRAFGASIYSGTGDAALPPNIAIFLRPPGRGGDYPAHCGRAAGGAVRAAPLEEP